MHTAFLLLRTFRLRSIHSSPHCLLYRVLTLSIAGNQDSDDISQGWLAGRRSSLHAHSIGIATCRGLCICHPHSAHQGLRPLRVSCCPQDMILQCFERSSICLLTGVNPFKVFPYFVETASYVSVPSAQPGRSTQALSGGAKIGQAAIASQRVHHF